MREFIKVMKALSEPSRVKIIKLLQHRPLCVCEAQAALQLAQPTISKHLKILEDAGLVTHTKDGLWVNYQLADGSQSPYASTLLGSLKHWLDGEQDMKELMKKIKTISREGICKLKHGA